MSTRPIIFISAVSKELHSARDHVAKTLISLGYEPKWQDIAPTETGMLPQVLRGWIDQSDAVIQLVGHHYGFAPKEPDAEFGECSYTQLEALYARQQAKKVWYLILTPEHPTDPCAAEASTLRDLQDAYRTKVKSTSHLYHSTSTLDKTELLVRRIKNELAELRQKEQARQDQLQQSIDSTHQKVTDLSAEVLARFDDLKQQAHHQPKLLLTPESWPQPAPFHNRAFPDQHNFVGRAALLSAMKQSLDAERNVALTQPVAMHGAGGIGKTRAAVEFARAHGSTYTLCLFLDAQSPESLRASLAEVARKLELTTDPQASADALVLLALRLLRAVPTALVVADNADTPAALEAVRLLCHEPGGVRWLITTRLTDLGEEFAPQRVDLLDEPEAVQLLQKRGSKNGHQPSPDTDALAIAKELGRLPLALQQAAAYVAHMRLTWTAYSKLLADNPAQALSYEAKEMKDLPESILRTYTISLQQVTPLARRVLEVAAHLASAPIPEAVFLPVEIEESFRAALVELADLSLLEWQADKLEVHRAIAIAVCLGLDQEADRRARLELACSLVSTCCASQDPQHPDHWPAWAALRPHIEHLLAWVGPADAEEQSYVWLLASWPNYLYAIGEYAASEGFYRSSIACQQHTVGAEHQSTLMTRNNLAEALRRQGKYTEAERELRELLQIQKRVLGAEHLQTLMSRNNLALALDEQGRHGEAEQEHRAVLPIMERVLGVEHPETLTSRNNLVRALQVKGKHVEAEHELRAIIKIKERVLGAEYPDTLASRMNLVSSLRAQGKPAEAAQEQRAVSMVQERVLGKEHPDTLKGRMYLANALFAQGKHAEAEQENREVLQIQARVLGAEHPNTLLSRMNLGATLQVQGKHAEAEQEQRTVCQIQQRVLGEEHPETLANRNNLATTLQDRGKHVEAEQELRIVFQILKRVLGEEHSSTLMSRNNLAIALDDQGKHAAAEQEHREVLQLRECVLGVEHHDVAQSCYNLALGLVAQQKLSEALKLIQRAEQVWTKSLGPDHPNTKAAKAARERLEAALK